MDIFAKLAVAACRGNTEGELPDFIMPLLMKVVDNPADFSGREELVAELVMRVEQYETWSELCCEKQGFSLEDIHRTLDRLKIRY
ncbi:MAG: GSU3529 family protein [Desulfuromonadales bacterium]